MRPCLHPQTADCDIASYGSIFKSPSLASCFMPCTLLHLRLTCDPGNIFVHSGFPSMHAVTSFLEGPAVSFLLLLGGNGMLGPTGTRSCQWQAARLGRALATLEFLDKTMHHICRQQVGKRKIITVLHKQSAMLHVKRHYVQYIYCNLKTKCSTTPVKRFVLHS